MQVITRTSALLVSVVAFAMLGSVAWAKQVEGSGVSKTEQRDVGEFEKIRVNGSANVKVVIGDKRSVSVTTDDNLLRVIDTVVKDGTLVIGGNQNFSTRLGVTVQITRPPAGARLPGRRTPGGRTAACRSPAPTH